MLFIERGPLPSGPTHDVEFRTQWIYAEDPEGRLHETFDIEATPYAFVVGSSREVVSKGIVNDIRDLEGVLSLALEDNAPEGSRESRDGEASPVGAVAGISGN